MNEKEIDKLFHDIWVGKTTPKKLPKKLYELNRKPLTQQIYNGIGQTKGKIPHNTEIYNISKSFEKNIQEFSAAKTQKQLDDYIRLLYDEQGSKVSLTQFKDEAAKVFDIYNSAWLSAEKQATNSQSSSAAQWLDIQANKESLPMLTYQTVADDRVRDDHAILDGASYPVDNEFWDTYFPPLDWGCRCIAISDVAGETKEVETLPTTNPIFEGNAAKDGVIFNESHPYFEGQTEKEKLTNYGLGYE